jgi:hypothetical protein
VGSHLLMDQNQLLMVSLIAKRSSMKYAIKPKKEIQTEDAEALMIAQTSVMAAKERLLKISAFVNAKKL